MSFCAKLRATLRRKKIDAEMREEMRLHLEQRTAENIAAGLAPEDARHAAQRRFGHVGGFQEVARAQRSFAGLEQFSRDLRFAGRSLAQNPGFTAIALLTLALGIGVNTTAFSVLNTLLLHRLPYPQSERLVRVFQTSPDALGRPSDSHAPANFLDYRAQNDVFERLAAWQWTSFNLGEPGQPAERVLGLSVTADFFPMLGVAPELGRAFAPEEDRPGNDAVVLISHGTWLERFGADPGIVGRSVRVNGEPVTIVGVMPANFDDLQFWGDVRLWRPMALTDQQRQDRNNSWMNVGGRLKPGVSLREAQTAMTALAGRLATAFPEFNAHSGLQLGVLAESGQDRIGRGLTWLVMGLAALVLLIACANLANLQFARNLARGREYAVRAALGASRGQLLRQVLTESVLLSIGGGALAAGLAVWGNDLLSRCFVWGEHVGLDIPLDGRVLGFTSAVSLFTGIGFGVLPAWLAARANVSDALKPGGRGTTAGRTQHRVRHALIVAEVALALVLLSGASFFLRGVQRFTQRDPGWRTDGLLTAYVTLRGPAYAAGPARTEFFRRLEVRLAALPGVERLTIGSSLPTFGFSNDNSFVVEGQPEPPPNRAPSAAAADVMPGYFDFLGVRLLQGRDFDAGDREDSPAVVIINETMARRFWPGENPIGKRIGGATPFMKSPRMVVGVVSDVRPIATLGIGDGRFQMYRPLAQRPPTWVTIALRTRTAPEAIAPEIRQVIAGIDSDVAAYRITTLQQETRRSLASVAVAGWSLLAFAMLGVLLAAVGIYGVIANTVAQRTSEIGLRMALGAQVPDILRLIVAGGLRLALLGAAIGLVGAWAIARVLPAISPEFGGANASLTFGVTVFLLLVATVACWLPARRAMKVDPIVALRAE